MSDQPKVTAAMLRANMKALRKAVREEKALFDGCDWALFEKSWHWFNHRKRISEDGQVLFKELWEEA